MNLFPDKESLDKLNDAAYRIVERKRNQLGYPFNQDTGMSSFYEWLAKTGLGDITLINVADPYKEEWDMLNSDEFERESLDFYAEKFGFKNGHWGVISNGGTDGNMHGVYFGRKYLESKTKIPPVLYVSEEAHYSVKKLGDVLNIETKTISARKSGQMDTEDFRVKLDSSRPALVAIAIGGTFKGAIDDQREIGKILNEKNPPAVYRHLDAALFGGYLPFLEDPSAAEIVDSSTMGFDSIAISGHKFLSLNEPAGLFICKPEVHESVKFSPVPYLNGDVPTVSCSRSGFDALKFYWMIKSTGEEGFKVQSKQMLDTAKFLQSALVKRGVGAKRNPYSNTVYFPRPSDKIVRKYALACNTDAIEGNLSHIVVMQYFTKDFAEKLADEISGV